MSKKRRILKKPNLSRQAALLRMGRLLATGHGTEQDAEVYNRLQSEFLLDSALGCIAKAEANKHWEHMEGCFKQASEIYVLASILYEKHPQYTIMSDGAFDALARFLLKNEHKIDPDFWRWYNISAIDLRAGTGHAVTMQAPVLRMLDLHLERNRKPDGNRPRILRRKAKRGSEEPAKGGGEAPRRVIRKAGGVTGDRKGKIIKRPKRP